MPEHVTASPDTIGKAIPTGSPEEAPVALTFEYVLPVLRQGGRIRRLSRPGILFMQVPSSVPAEFIPKMSSLPPEVKSDFVAYGGPAMYHNQIAQYFQSIRQGQGAIVVGYSPSVEDILATDWVVVP